MRKLYVLLFVAVMILPANAGFFYNLFKAPAKKADRLLVITEPSWCPPCRALDPHLQQLKKEGYDVRIYAKAEWKKAKPKPSNLPPKVKTGKYAVPTVMYVTTQDNNVIRHHLGGPSVTAAYIKQYLTK